MQIGILFPQTEIGTDPAGLRDYAQAVVGLGFKHLVAYEHVLGAQPERLPEGYRPYTIDDPFHEVMTLFAYLAAAAPALELATGILVLPQRQAPLVAKQAVQLSLLTGGKFRLGVGIGWNGAEFEGMGCDFKSRARRFEEQIEVMRELWAHDVVNFSGEFHQLVGVGLKPRATPPVWIGAGAEKAVQRAARLADGWFPQKPFVNDSWKDTLGQVRQWREEAGKPWEGFGVEPRLEGKPGWASRAQEMKEAGATHVYLTTMKWGRQGPAQHIELLTELAREL